MAEQWIEAALARQLVTAAPFGVAGLNALLERVHAGLVKARARLLILGDRRAESAAVPSEVWVTGSRAKLEQDWAAGDFSGRLDGLGDDRWKAFGVTFELSGILDILPFEKRATTARGLSVAGNAGWVTARAARKFAYEKAGINPRHAATAIIGQGQLGFLTSRAVLAKRADGQRTNSSTWEQSEWDIPAWFWQNLADDKTGSQDWELGILTAKGSTPKGTYALTLTGVHFLAESLRVLLPASETEHQADTTPAETSTKDNPGGRPPAAWWDDMWCDVWGLIYEGKLIPKTQADIETAMHSWAQDRGHSPADSTIRLKARKLYKVISNGVENPPAP